VDHGIKIAKDGFSASEIPTEATKKNYIILNSVDAHKLVYAGMVSGGSYTHNLTYVPFHFAFQVDSVVTPTVFSPIKARVTTTEIFGLPSSAYIMLFNEGF